MKPNIDFEHARSIGATHCCITGFYKLVDGEWFVRFKNEWHKSSKSAVDGSAGQVVPLSDSEPGNTPCSDSGPRYQQRDIILLDKAGNYYARHIYAMTAEDLYSKSDIAAELGWRDMEIDRLKLEITQLKGKQL